MNVFGSLKIKHPKVVFRSIEIKVGMRNVTIHMMVISFSLMKSMEVSFLGSSDQIELNLVHLNTVQINFDSWDDFTREFIGLIT